MEKKKMRNVTRLCLLLTCLTLQPRRWGQYSYIPLKHWPALAKLRGVTSQLAMLFLYKVVVPSVKRIHIFIPCQTCSSWQMRFYFAFQAYWSMCSGTSSSSLAGSGSNSAAGTNSSGRSLRNDLLVAADSVTNAMSTLVRELNSGTSQKRSSQL